MTKIIYPELSYKIIGALYQVFNNLRFGHQERIYQRAVAEEFSKNKIGFKRELYWPIRFNDKIISKYYFDFLVEDKIVLELKIANDFYGKDMAQLLSYLKANHYRLGILAIFTRNGLKYKRIAN